MKILIDQTELDLLLEKKKKFIGTTVVWDSLLSALSFLLSVFFATYKDFFIVPGIAFKTIFCILGLFFTGKSVKDICSAKHNNYTKEDLLYDINKLNKITHNHSIVIVKDTYNDFSNRFLLYYDSSWDCKLFINCKSNPNNERFILEHLSNELKVPQNSMSISFLEEQIHEKYSEKHKENRYYKHDFYKVSLDNFPELLKSDSFVIDGKEYFWMSMAEMEQDERISEVNHDIVNYVKAICS